MRSLNTSSLNKKGFTLIELLIAMAIMTGFMALGLFLAMDALHASYSRSERDTVVAILEKARSRAMANMYQSMWGVCYVSPNYVLFRGSVCDPTAATSELTGAAASASITGMTQVAPVVFTALSGTTTATTIIVAEQGRTSTISINYEGTIVW